jgi:hypothetical protein
MNYHAALAVSSSCALQGLRGAICAGFGLNRRRFAAYIGLSTNNERR